MKAQVLLRVGLSSEKALSIMLKALGPDIKAPPSRSKIRMTGSKKDLILRLEAKDTMALRAAVNSYLNWVALISETYSALEHLSRKDGGSKADSKTLN